MKKEKTKILFIGDKWCNGDKKFGSSEWEAGMLSSLESTGMADISIFHLDEYFDLNEKKGDEAVIQKIKTEKPDMIYIVMYQMPGSAVNVLDFSTLDEIKNNLKIPMAAVWGDLASEDEVKVALAVLPYTTLTVATELESVITRINKNKEILYMWVPRDPRIFNNPSKMRDIDIGYVGSPKNERLKKILFLVKNGVKVTYGGGERQEHLSLLQYTDRYQRSKIALSFARAGAFHVINARPFEVMLCGAMLLEQEGFETMKMYTPYVDYVPYTSKKDLLKKTRYYTERNEEREKIARSGQKKTEELYSAKRYWEVVIDQTLNYNPEKQQFFGNKIPPESIAKISTKTALKLKLLNSLCSNPAGYMLYKICHRKYWQEFFSLRISKLKPLVQKMLPKKFFDFLLTTKRKLY